MFTHCLRKHKKNIREKKNSQVSWTGTNKKTKKDDEFVQTLQGGCGGMGENNALLIATLVLNVMVLVVIMVLLYIVASGRQKFLETADVIGRFFMPRPNSQF